MKCFAINPLNRVDFLYQHLCYAKILTIVRICISASVANPPRYSLSRNSAQHLNSPQFTVSPLRHHLWNARRARAFFLGTAIAGGGPSGNGANSRCDGFSSFSADFAHRSVSAICLCVGRVLCRLPHSCGLALGWFERVFAHQRTYVTSSVLISWHVSCPSGPL